MRTLHLYGTAAPSNKKRWSGVLTRLDEPSTRPPGGAGGHLVVIPKALAARTLHQLVSMPVNAAYDLEDHERGNICGTIDRAWIEGRDLCVEGKLYDRNEPDLVQRIQDAKGRLGMSYEITSVQVKNTQASIWELEDLEWCGASILLKSKAAYESTSIAARAAKQGNHARVLAHLRREGRRLDGLAPLG